MTRAEQSYLDWYLSRNGMAATDHSVHRIPYVTGYEAGECDLRARLISAVKTALVRDASMQKVADLIRDI
jgi:hypothetical protein